MPFMGVCCFLLVFLCLSGAINFAQTTKNKVTQIEMLYSDSMNYEEEINVDVWVPRGNVVFRHDSTYMYCDSAYLHKKTNMLEAFDNVRIEQGDTLFIYGDYLIYEGNIQLAKMRNNVRMEHRIGNSYTTLLTDSFNYDRAHNIAYYFDGGMLIDSANELTSVYGQYLPAIKEATFRKDVQLVNNKMKLSSDTLIYWTDTKIATIVGPSVIESDSGTIYSRSGWYNTVTDDSRLFDRSTVVSKAGDKTLTADTLFFNQLTGFGEAFGNMVLNDTVKKIILTGNYGWYDDPKGNALATDSAQCIEYSQGDSLFLHADTLKMFTIANDQREMLAYYGVRFYRTDLQGVCDSMQFNTADSILYLFTEPILWNSGYQLTGDTIHIHFNDSTVDNAHVFNYAFAVEEVDSLHHNQLKGNDLRAYFDNGELRNIYVSGNAETIYYPIENDGSFIGLNHTESGFFSIYLENKQLEKMVIWPKPIGYTIPIPDLTPENKYLKGFILFEYLRPKNHEEIFLDLKRRPEDVAPKKNRRFIY